jgi:hypothetical protein
MSSKIKSIKPFLKGTEIPVGIDDAHRGKYIEGLYEEQGFEVNKGLGADFRKEKIDIKSRKLESSSPHTITTCTEDHLIARSYKNSNVYPKAQRWDQPVYSESYHEIVRHENYDFRDSYIQDIIESGYEDCRSQLVVGVDGTFIRSSNGYVVFEKTNRSTDSWQVRFPHSAMKKLKGMSKQVTNNNLFEFGLTV